MPNKQVKMQFLVDADDDLAVNLTVKVDGVVKYSGSVPQTKNEIDPASVNITDLTEAVEFNFDAPVFERGTGKISTLAVKLAELTHTQAEIEVAVDGGSVICRSIQANYSPQPTVETPESKTPIWQSSGAGNYVDCIIVGQPMRNGVAALDKFDGSLYFGAGTVTRPNGEQVTADLPAPYFAITNESISANYAIPKYQ